MKKYKNIVFIVCDSITNYNQEFLKENFTFYNKYKENIISFDGITSQAPYTEAALVPLLTSTNTIEHKGYLNNLKYKPYTINEIFKDLGYKTFNSLYYYPNTSSFKRGVDEYYYYYSLSIYAFNEYRLKYYRDVYNKGNLTEIEKNDLVEQIEDFFDVMVEYFYDYLNYPESFVLLKKYSDINDDTMKSYSEILLNEKRKFENNKIKYAEELLIHDNELMTIKDVNIKVSDEFTKRLKEVKGLCLYNSAKQVLRNICRGRKNGVFEYLKTTNIKDLKYTILNVLNFTAVPLHELPTIKLGLDVSLEYLKNNRDKNNFLYIHTMDTHFPYTFISSEINDKDLINNEIVALKKNIKKKKNTNNVFYGASISFTSDKIEEFVDDLRREGILEDTLVVITSDHGSSYTGDIFRKNKVCNMYEENYRVPLYFYNPKIEGKTISGLGSNLDVIPTIVDFIGMDSNKYELSGKSILKECREYVIYQYFGSGCPNTHKKDRFVTIKNHKYKINCQLSKEMIFREDTIFSIYDLENDKYELNNIRDSVINSEDIKYLISELVKYVGQANREEI